MKLRFFTFLYCLLKCSLLQGQTIAGDLADPSIIKVDSVYYATGTSSEWAPYFPIYKSSNLKDWQQTGYVFDKAPAWTVGSFWAPEYYKIGNTYYIYYTARRKSDNRSYIGVATSPYPDHGFTDHGVIIEHGKEAIDAFIFNDGGQLYITFKAYGLDDRPIELLGAKLSADGLKTEGEFFSILKDTSRAGMEGQSILKMNNYYYLFYSAGNCCGQGCSYSVNVGRSASFKGPYQLFDGNPILSENDTWKCMGHGTFVDNKYYLHHAYNKKSTVFTGREGLLAELIYQEYTGWPLLKTITHNNKADLNDPFDGRKLANYWQWDFRHSTPSYQLQKGMLRLSGKQTKDNPTGIVLTVRPTSDNFDISTSVVNRNKALKGLTIYGDVNAAIGIGVEGDSVKVWKMEKKQRVIIKAALVPPSDIGLKISMSPNRTCNFFYQAGNATWTELASGVETGSLPQWDRSPRLGLHYSGNEKDKAEFSFFRLENK
ncbi:family 43 glycosylhydrolase [Chitinophaga sp. SYP-B3965]|uniref:family 43 glycosylhydrolase n=1 Tax=Chitinophaga sp. SYP-B3965 TaxID=2663120 RepID=UPI00129952D4|nr:family 43 glycosylhydrolase [Chitinophaga sp. SYP-B3965]MRG44256.1 family 43 glycosylhydrolase [Chitinophaga sp. SYP-B3965]